MNVASRILCLGLLIIGSAVASASQSKDGLPVIPTHSSSAGQLDDGKLTEETLVAKLRDMGYEPRLLPATGGPNRYTIKVRSSQREWVVIVALSPNQQFVWLQAFFTQLPQGQKPSPQQMEKLLDLNLDVGPAHFRYDAPNRQLSVATAVANRALTVAQLRTEIDVFSGVIERTMPFWTVS